MAKEYPTSVHLTKPLKARLQQAAKLEKRSLSSQIRFILDLWLQARYPEPPSPKLAQNGDQA